ncbi:chemotaxis protein CheW [Noviherbaspirillum sp. Root189]|uniref:chemotaxis protein CheW n=1 Tax=Noviherbaspirillum sp. Root189 TaxID=1736487 RepID=UPI00070CE03D|nr:chemotaxis protein CheW [Noviherbaspirillum sp. Root189]KRB92902.1 hypothetical protein ASE07_14845 [Noviherbaspirillum sp. Root189]
MRYLVFHLGKDRYGLATRELVRVLPLMELKALPQAPDYVAGIMNLHGAPVPVIDLCALASGKPHTARYDTRILLVAYPDATGTVHDLGLIAEGVAGFANIDADQLSDTGVSNPQAPYLGEVTAQDGKLLQLVDLPLLLPAQIRDTLFVAAERSVS